MKKFNYYILGVLLVSMLLSGMSNLWAQNGSIRFMETFSCEEVRASLDAEDKLFTLLEVNQLYPESSKVGDCKAGQITALWEHIQSEAFLTQLPEGIIFAWGVPKDDQSRSLHALKKKSTPRLDEADIQKVDVKKDKDADNYSLWINFSKKGAEKWASLTGNNIGRDIAIVINGTVYSAPRLMEQIKGGECVISGKFTESEIHEFKNLLDSSLQ